MRRSTYLSCQRTAIALAAAMAALTFGLPARAQDVVEGGEFRAHAATTGSQVEPAVAIAPDGSFLMVWQESFELNGRIYDAQGVPQASEFEVGPGLQPHADVDGQGRFVVAWADTARSKIEARRFDSQGSPIGSTFQVSTATTLINLAQPRISANSSGQFVITWSSIEPGMGPDVRARRYNADGSANGNEFAVPEFAAFDELPSVALANDGGFVVAWTGNYFSRAVLARPFDANGTGGAQFRLNTFTTSDQRIPQVARNGEDFMVIWESAQQDGEQAGIVGRRLSADGAPSGEEFVINTTTAGAQIAPQISSSAEGAAVVTWWELTAGQSAVRARRFDVDGVALGDDFAVNSWTTDTQRDPIVASGIDGDFVIAWESSNQDGDGSGVYAQRYRTSKVGDRVFRDLDLNGIQDEGDPGVEGIAVHLYEDPMRGAPLRSATTDADGNYVFGVLPDGDYYVDFELPGEFSFTAADVGGDDTVDSDADPLSGETADVTIGPGVERLDVDAGLARGLGDRVWLDDGDGVQEDGELGIAGVTVRVLGGDQTVTDADGRYVLDPAPGSVVLEVDVPAGHAPTLQNTGLDETLDSDFDETTAQTGLVFGAGDVETFWDAGLVALSQISDFVWNDLDGDGVQDSGEPGLEGVTVTLLDDSDNEVDATTSDTDGFYSFTGAADGSYRIEVEIPGGYITAPQDQTGDDLDCDVDDAGRSALFSVSQEIRRDLDIGLLLEPPLFADGFESGGIGEWTASFP